jgi:shikimate kinase
MGVAIVLVGAPGSGKSTVGRLLAADLGLAFRDTDDDVARAAGMAVNDIFVTEGEPSFRKREEAAVLSALAEHQGVLALGGGAVQSEKVRAALSGHRVVWLQVDAATAVSRVGLSGPRPVLLGNLRAQWAQLLTARTPWYESVANWSIDTTGRTPQEVAAAVAAERMTKDG